MSKIRDLNSNPWRTAEDLANALGISVRSVYRRLDKGTVEKVEKPEGTRYRNCQFTDVSERQYVSSREPADILVTDVLRQLEAAHNRIAGLERDAGRAEVLADVLTSQAAELERAREEAERWRTEAESARHEAITWRARYHVARGRVEMDED